MEITPVIRVPEMTQFVEKNIVSKKDRETHQIEVQIYISARRTAAPIRPVVFDCYPVVDKTVLGGKKRETGREIFLCLGTKPFHLLRIKLYAITDIALLPLHRLYHPVAS